MMHESFFFYRNGCYLWYSLGLVVGALLLYAFHAPLESPNGGTWLGYTLGAIAALLIVWLLMFGIRKRSHYSRLGSMQGWLSAHIYLGGALPIIASLHCGFQFGWNVHTITYALMALVIVSGFFGVFLYARYPRLIANNRSGQTRERLIEQLDELDRKALGIAASIDPDTKFLVQSAAERTVVGGNWRTQLAAKDRSRLLDPEMETDGRLIGNADQKELFSRLHKRLARTQDGHQIEHLQNLLGVIAEKQTLLQKVRRDVQLQGLVESWLYLHIPLAYALLGSLLAHVLAVFYYW